MAIMNRCSATDRIVGVLRLKGPRSMAQDQGEQLLVLHVRIRRFKFHFTDIYVSQSELQLEQSELSVPILLRWVFTVLTILSAP